MEAGSEPIAVAETLRLLQLALFFCKGLPERRSVRAGDKERNLFSGEISGP